jgi:hypothetical protein
MRWKIASAAVLALGVAVPLTSAEAGTTTSTPTCLVNGAPATPTAINILAGDSQSAVVGSAFGTRPQLELVDASGNPVTSCLVSLTETPASNGAQAIFASNGRTTYAHETGKTSGKLREGIIANAYTGSYTITATVVHFPSVTATFSETNLAAKASSSVVPSTIAPGSCTKFYYSVDTTSWNVISVYGARGKRRALAELGTQTPGLHAWRWCGKDSSGAQVQAGNYTIKLAARVGTGFTAPIVATTQQIVTVK